MNVLLSLLFIIITGGRVNRASSCSRKRKKKQPSLPFPLSSWTRGQGRWRELGVGGGQKRRSLVCRRGEGEMRTSPGRLTVASLRVWGRRAARKVHLQMHIPESFSEPLPRGRSHRTALRWVSKSPHARQRAQRMSLKLGVGWDPSLGGAGERESRRAGG